jgi:hypothetical protein
MWQREEVINALATSSLGEQGMKNVLMTVSLGKG